MSNQDQFSETPQEQSSTVTSEFSTRRRVFTAGLVLLAACLLGYLLYFSLFAPDETPSVTPTTEQPMDTLEAFEQEVIVPTEEQRVQLEAFEQEVSVPTEEQQNSLNNFLENN